MQPNTHQNRRQQCPRMSDNDASRISLESRQKWNELFCLECVRAVCLSVEFNKLQKDVKRTQSLIEMIFYCFSRHQSNVSPIVANVFVTFAMFGIRATLSSFSHTTQQDVYVFLVSGHCWISSRCSFDTFLTMLQPLWTTNICWRVQCEREK